VVRKQLDSFIKLWQKQLCHLSDKNLAKIVKQELLLLEGVSWNLFLLSYW